MIADFLTKLGASMLLVTFLTAASSLAMGFPGFAEFCMKCALPGAFLMFAGVMIMFWGE